MRQMAWWMAAAAVVSGCNGGAGYGDDFGGERVFSGCDPLDTALCALPFPSDFFTAPDDTTETGKRVRFWDGSDCADYVPGVGENIHPIFLDDVDGAEGEGDSRDPCTNSLPVNVDGVAVKPHFLNEKDGFSPSGTILTYFDDVSLDGVVNHWSLEDVAAGDVKTVILDPEGRRIPHWVELDMTTDDPGQRLLMLRPAEVLDFSTTYTVGIRGLTKNAGGSVDVGDAFAWLRDGKDWEGLDREDAANNVRWDVESRRDRYDEVIFPALEADGFARADLQLAWEFTTASRQSTLGRMELIRDDMATRVPTGGPAYTITDVETEDCSVDGTVIGKTVYADLTVPYYTEIDESPTFLSRDADGNPTYVGDTEIEIMVRVPCSIIDDPSPSRILQYGHGLLGDKSEARTGWLSRFAEENRLVVFAMDWKGMATDDADAITFMLVGDISAFPMLPERAHQGINEWVLGAQAMKGGFGQDAEFAFGDPGSEVNVVDPTDIVYYGNSQGGIMGGAYMGLTTEVQRGVLGVPGGPYNILLTRSTDFDPFFLVFKTKFQDHREIAMGIAMMQMPWDPAEGSGWITSMRGHDLPDGMEPKEILLHVGIGDAQVTPLGAHLMARGYGAQTIAPETRPIFGIEEASTPFSGAAIVEYEYLDVPVVPDTNIPPGEDFDTHECPRRDPAGQEQIVHWWNTGEFIQTCDGACVHETSDWCR